MDRIGLGPVDPDGPAGAFARTVHTALGYLPVVDLVDPADARELLRRALGPGGPGGALAYPALDRVEAERPGGLAAGLVLLARAIAHQHEAPPDPANPDLGLLVGTVIPVPGPGRVPVVEAVTEGPPGFAEVVYAYPGDAGTHRLSYYRAGAAGWRLDLVRELARAGSMQSALGGVQEGPCPGDAEAFEV